MHAPHSASPQPYFVPVRPSTSRSAHSSGISGSTSSCRSMPLTRIVMLIAAPPRCGHSAPVSTHAATMRAELLLRARRRLRGQRRRPAPRDELVVRVVLDDLRERLAAVALRILHLLADLARASCPPTPSRAARGASRARRARALSQVAILMAARALHPDDAVVLGAARDRRLVRGHLHALERARPVRVAVGAARMEKHPAGFEEQRARPISSIRDHREIGDGAQLVTGDRRQSRNVTRSAGGRRHEGDNQAKTKDG